MTPIALLLVINGLLLLINVLIGQCLANHGPTIVHNGTFNVDQRQMMNKLQSALENENMKTTSAIICSINNDQRQELAEAFKKRYGKDLIASTNAKIKDFVVYQNFRDLMVALIQSAPVFDAKQMCDALNVGKREVLIEILATRTNRQIAELKQAYAQLPTNKQHQSLEQDIKAKTKGGDFQTFLLSLLKGARDEDTGGTTNTEQAKEDAQMLFNMRRTAAAGTKKLLSSAQSDKFNQVLATRNIKHLRQVFTWYESNCRTSIEEFIKAEFSEYTQMGYLALIEYIRDSSKYFAHRLHESLKVPSEVYRQFGIANFVDLTRLVVSRSEIDLADIKTAFKESYQMSLEEAIENATKKVPRDKSGNVIKLDKGLYEDALLALVKGNRSETMTEKGD